MASGRMSMAGPFREKWGQASLPCLYVYSKFCAKSSKEEASGRAYYKYRFIHGEAGDSHIRLQGRRLTFQRYMQADTARVRLYRTDRGVRQRCPAFGVCAIGRIHGRGSGTGAHEETLLRLHALMSTGEARRASRRWGRLAGPVSGILKERMEMRRFALRDW